MVRLPQTLLAYSFAISALFSFAVSPAIAQSNTNLRIMPLGDSITAGYLSSTNNGYRGPLATDLAGQVLYLDFVGGRVDGTMSDPDNEGNSGFRIDQIAALTTFNLNMYKPNVVTLLAGINDLDQDYEVSTAPDRLASLIDQILSNEPDATVLVANLIIRNDSTDEPRVQTFNAALPNIVNTRASAGKHVYLVDTSALTLSDLSDGLHPNDGGYKKLGDAFYAGVQAAISKGWIKDPVAGSATRPTGSLYSGVAGKCLDGGALTQGTKAAISSCTGGASQQWNLNNGNTDPGYGNVVINGQCLDIVGSATANKSPVQLYGCNKGLNQVWTITNGTLVNPTSGRCLDDPGSSTTNGTQLQIYDCNGGSNQQWLMPAQGPVTSSLSGKCLDDKGGSPNVGTHVDSFACNNNFSQQWSIYNNLLQYDGRCVSVVGGATGNGSLVDIEACTGASSQTWTPTNGTLVNSKSGRCLDIPGSSTTDGIQLDIADCSGGSNQKWAIPNL